MKIYICTFQYSNFYIYIVSWYPSNERKMLMTGFGPDFLQNIFLLSVWFDHIKLRLIPDVVDVKIKDSDKISVPCLSTIKVRAENSTHSSRRLPQLSPTLGLVTSTFYIITPSSRFIKYYLSDSTNIHHNLSLLLSNMF